MYTILTIQEQDENLTNILPYHYKTFKDGTTMYQLDLNWDVLTIFVLRENSQDLEDYYSIVSESYSCGTYYKAVDLLTPNDSLFSVRDLSNRDHAILFLNGEVFTGKSHTEALGLNTNRRAELHNVCDEEDEIIIASYHKANTFYTDVYCDSITIYLPQETDYITVDAIEFYAQYMEDTVMSAYPDIPIYTVEY